MAMRKNEVIPKFLDGLVDSKTPKATLRDHLLRVIKPTVYPDYRSYMIIAARCLRDTHQHLVGTTVFPSVRKFGPKPAWSGDAPEMEDTIPLPEWTSSTQLVALVQGAQDVGAVIDAKHIATISKLGRRAYTAAIGAIGSVTKQAASLKERVDEEVILRQAAEDERDRERRDFEARLARIESVIPAIAAPPKPTVKKGTKPLPPGPKRRLRVPD